MKEQIIKLFSEKKLLIISILIALFIEIFICNYGFFRTILVGNTNIKCSYSITDNKITISNIGSRVTSIRFNYNNKLTDKITYELHYTAEENSYYFSINPKIVLPSSKQYINFDTHSNCKTIDIDLLTESDLEINSIIINHPNMNISFIRIILFFFISLLLLKVNNKSIYNIQYNKNSKIQNNIFLMILLEFCVIISSYILIQTNNNSFWVSKDNINKSDSLLMQTEAIINGQIKLMEEPSDELKEMENPYDNIKRDDDNVEFLYDVAYYNGNYYNYFGIAPIITSILPFRLLTGGYTHQYIYNMFYMLIAILALYSLYKKLINKYIKNISLVNFYLGFYAILFASNILTLLRGAKYDTVVTSGIVFLLISLNLAISIYENNKFKNIKLVLLGITTALIVLSKPNLIIYYLLIAFFYLIGLSKQNKKEIIKNLLFTTIPLGLLAIFQMILNYIRFNNILEFGAKYQLTGFNMSACMSITFGKIYAGILEYIFKTPTIKPLEFPFVFINTNTNVLSINEICYENRLYGLIALPILYAFFLKKFIIKNTQNKEFSIFINLCIITSIISIILNSCFGGICETYSIDFKLILSIGAILLLLKWVELKNNDDINKIFFILTITTILLMIPISLTTENNFLENFASNTTVFLKNIFEFWS